MYTAFKDRHRHLKRHSVIHIVKSTEIALCYIARLIKPLQGLVGFFVNDIN